MNVKRYVLWTSLFFWFGLSYPGQLFADVNCGYTVARPSLSVSR
jgi:hypothetical protein